MCFKNIKPCNKIVRFSKFTSNKKRKKFKGDNGKIVILMNLSILDKGDGLDELVGHTFINNQQIYG